MFVNHIIKPYMFRSQFFNRLQGAFFMLSTVTTSLLVCVVKLFIWYVAVCCLCVCVHDVLVCGRLGCELTLKMVKQK